MQAPAEDMFAVGNRMVAGSNDKTEYLDHKLFLAMLQLVVEIDLWNYLISS